MIYGQGFCSHSPLNTLWLIGRGFGSVAGYPGLHPAARSLLHGAPVRAAPSAPAAQSSQSVGHHRPHSAAAAGILLAVSKNLLPPSVRAPPLREGDACIPSQTLHPPNPSTNAFIGLLLVLTLPSCWTPFTERKHLHVRCIGDSLCSARCEAQFVPSSEEFGPCSSAWMRRKFTPCLFVSYVSVVPVTQCSMCGKDASWLLHGSECTLFISRLSLVTCI